MNQSLVLSSAKHIICIGININAAVRTIAANFSPNVSGGLTIFIFSIIHCGAAIGGNFCREVSRVKLLYLIVGLFFLFVVNLRSILLEINPVVIPSVNEDAEAIAKSETVRRANNAVFIV